jgi:hypothetical protein
MSCRIFLSRAIPLTAPLAVLLLHGVPVAAQADTTRFDRLWEQAEYDGPRRFELSVSGGYALSSDWSDRVALQVFDPQGAVHQQVLLRNMSIAPGAGVAGAVTYWRGRHGFRVSGGYSRSCLTTASRCVNGDTPPPAGDAALAIAEVPMDVYRYGVEGVVGLRDWESSRVFRPYLVVGAGGVLYDPDSDALPFVPGSFQTITPAPGAPNSVIISDGHRLLLVSTNELGLEHVFGATLGIGMDVRVPVGIGGLGLRVELADQITSSPFSVRVARLDASGRRFAGRDGDDVVFRKDGVHNLRVTAGLTLELGLPGPRTERNPWTW